MRKTASILAIALFAAALSPSVFAQVASVPATKAGAAAPAAPQAAPKAPEGPIYDEKADAKADIAAALVRAGKENRRVLIQWGGNWCGWCRLLHKLFKEDRAIAKALLYEYDVVMVDIGKFDKNLDLVAKYKADLKKAGVPFLTVLDSAGSVIVNQETSSLESGQGHDPKKVLDFLNAHKAPALEAKAVLDKALAEAKASGRRVFLHYGAPWCGWCKKLEAWMAQDSVAALLHKAYVEVKIDQDRMTGGMDGKKAYPASEKAGIPWFAALDPDGKVVATSTDSGANTGFPATDAEIAAFGEFLKKSGQGLTPADIESLLTSLKAANKK
jgi:thiol:disulfide interchange protein